MISCQAFISAFLIVADFAMSDDLMELTLCREVTTRVQKMRKEVKQHYLPASVLVESCSWVCI